MATNSFTHALLFAAISACTSLLTTTIWKVASAQPTPLETDKVVMNEPAVAYTCVVTGPVVLVVPSPKSQVHAVGLPVERSVKVVGVPIQTVSTE